MLNPMQLGVDPGLTGALAVLDPTTRAVEFYDTPVLNIKSGNKMKKVMDLYALATILHGVTSGRDVMVTMEKVNAMPGMGANGERQSMGATSAFNFGMGFGMWQGMFVALRLPFQLVHPKTWKALMMADCSKEKDASRLKAMQLFPEAAVGLNLKKHHGRADALLMAAFAARTYTPGQMEKQEAEFVLTSEEGPF